MKYHNTMIMVFIEEIKLTLYIYHLISIIHESHSRTVKYQWYRHYFYWKKTLNILNRFWIKENPESHRLLYKEVFNKWKDFSQFLI